MLRISEAESAIMEVVWRHGSAGTDVILAQAGETNGWAEATVRTLITRLLRKGALVSEKAYGRVLYRPLVPRADYVRSESQGFLDRLFDGEVGPMVAHFAGEKPLTAKDVEIMKRLIAEIEDGE